MNKISHQQVKITKSTSTIARVRKKNTDEKGFL